MSDKSHVRFKESLERQQDKYAPDQVNMAAANERTPSELAAAETRAPNVMDEQFPTNALGQEDPRDKIMNAKLQLQEGSTQTGYTPFGKLRATDADFKWLQRKEAAAERANMEAWFAKNFDFMSPAQKQFAKKIFPGFYDARRRLLRQQADNAFDVARIKLDGLEDFEDVKKQYLLDTGRLDLGPLQNLIHPEGVNDREGGFFDGSTANTRNASRFQRGLANPWLAFGKEAIPMDYATRKEQKVNFAARSQDAQWDTNASMGIRGVGFPPFAGDKSNQSTSAWYKNMQAALNAL